MIKKTILIFGLLVQYCTAVQQPVPDNLSQFFNDPKLCTAVEQCFVLPQSTYQSLKGIFTQPQNKALVGKIRQYSRTDLKNPEYQAGLIKEIEAKGFTIIKIKSTVVLSHPDLPGYFIKFLLKKESRPFQCVSRIPHWIRAKQMQNTHNLDNIALPEHKYYFYVGENPSSPQLCDEDYIVIAQVLPLDDLHNHARHLQALTTEQKQQVVIMICAGIRDICTTNLQFTPDGKVAFIDTEQANSNPSEIFFEKNREARVRSISKSLNQFNALLGEDFITEDQIASTINKYLQE